MDPLVREDSLRVNTFGASRSIPETEGRPPQTTRTCQPEVDSRTGSSFLASHFRFIPEVGDDRVAIRYRQSRHRRRGRCLSAS
ncbi:hypothetical protein MRX96_021766 [Rhipicephalus microplus]